MKNKFAASSSVRPNDLLERDFESLYQLYYGLIRSVTYRMVGSPNFEDLTQESFLKVWQQRMQFEGRSLLRTWIYRIAVNTCIDFLRKTKSAPVYLEPSQLDQFSKENLFENRRLLFEALQTLEAEDRTLVILHYFEDLKLSEISEILEIPEGTLKSRLYYIRESLLRFLEK